MTFTLWQKTVLEGNGAHYWTRVFLLMAIRGICTGEALIVKSCPTTRLSWEERARSFTCNTQNGFSYHCILDNKDELVEECVARIQVPLGKVGCPKVTFLRGVAYPSNKNSECPSDNPFCPSGKSAYFSDQLYIYPICFLNVSSRSQYTEKTSETMDNATENKNLERSKCKECGKDASKPCSAVWIVLGVVVAILLISNAAWFFICRSKKHKDLASFKLLCITNSGNDESQSSKQNGNHL